MIEESKSAVVTGHAAIVIVLPTLATAVTAGIDTHSTRKQVRLLSSSMRLAVTATNSLRVLELQ